MGWRERGWKEGGGEKGVERRGRVNMTTRWGRVGDGGEEREGVGRRGCGDINRNIKHCTLVCYYVLRQCVLTSYKYHNFRSAMTL